MSGHIKFEAIRPYVDSEIPAAMHRIAEHELFPVLASFVFPERDVEDVRRQVMGINTISQFQHEIMATVNERIIKSTTDGLAVDGLDYLDADTAYLFVSNHRDIMLDSSFLQYLLHINGLETSEITFGANLMTHPLVVDIGKANKMFRVERGGNKRDFYKFSLLNSEYIRHTLLEKKQSVWIAQRNGRTKDGLDRTEPGLIRMFAASGNGSLAEALSPLNITPVSISYEWETCDLQKTIELYISKFGKYQKEAYEDLKSILSGITAHKGHISICICKPITHEELSRIDSLAKPDQIKGVAALIDGRINRAYKLTPNNYIAADILAGANNYAEHYTPKQFERFSERLSSVMEFNPTKFAPSLMREIFLEIYANPLTR